MGFAVSGDNLSIITERMESGNLISYLKLNPEADRIRLVSNNHEMCPLTNYMETKCMDICAGLRYMHAEGMVRDWHSSTVRSLELCRFTAT